MGLPKDILVDSVIVSAQILSLQQVLENESLAGRITDIHLTIRNASTSREDFTQTLNRTFGLSLKPDQIPTDSSPVTGKDIFFADWFGYQIKNLAVARIIGNQLEAWLGPTLVHKIHPTSLNNGKEGVYIATKPGIPPETEGVSKVAVILNEQAAISRYFRTTVLDKPFSLANVCAKLGNAGINICELNQPETKPEAQTAEIAFLLDPCQETQLKFAINQIWGLPQVLSVNSLFRVIGHPTRDKGKFYKSNPVQV